MVKVTAECVACEFTSDDLAVDVCPRCDAIVTLVQRDEAQPTAAELLTLQETLSRAYLARMDAVNGYVGWPPDALAGELDELASDVAFERYGRWLCPVAG